MKYTISVIETVCYSKDIEADDVTYAMAQADKMEEEYNEGKSFGIGERIEIYSQVD